MKFNPFSLDPSIALQSVSPMEGKTVALKTVENKRFISLESGSVEVTKIHGPFYTDDYFGTLNWSTDEQQIVYIAEKLEPSDDTKFHHYYDAGEGYTGKRVPVCCIYDLKSQVVQVLDYNSLWGIAQPFFYKNQLYFVGIEAEPTKLGVKYCTNRRTGLYKCSLDDPSKLERLSDPEKSVRYPQLSPDQSEIVYLCNPSGSGPHASCDQIVSFNIHSGKERVIVDYVQEPKSINDFPGIYAYTIKDYCWASTKSLILTGIWRSRTVILSINIENGAVSNLTPNGLESWSVLRCTLDGYIICLKSSPKQPSTLCLLKLADNTCTVLDTPSTTDQIKSYLENIEYSIHTDIGDRTTMLEVIMMKSKTKLHSFGQQVTPLICLPHGGPHGSLTTSWSISLAAFLTLGFAVLCVK